MKSSQEMLADDHAGQGLKSLKEELFQMGQDLKKNMDKGMSQEEMSIAMAYKEAIDKADSALDNLHNKINK